MRSIQLEILLSFALAVSVGLADGSYADSTSLFSEGNVLVIGNATADPGTEVLVPIFLRRGPAPQAAASVTPRTQGNAEQMPSNGMPWT